MFYNYRPDGLSEKGMSKHTPGPWYAHPATQQVVDKEMWFDEHGARHGDTPNMVIDCNSVADTHLISAAPDMLAALEHILGGALSLPRFAEEQASAAVAKAKGE